MAGSAIGNETSLAHSICKIPAVRLASLLAVASMAVLLGACGLDMQGLEVVSAEGDSGAGDGAAMDSSTVVDTGTPDHAPCTAADGCYVIPPNWQLVAAAADRSAACPAGFAATEPADLDEGPDASNACTCSCSIAGEPTCPTSPVVMSVDKIGFAGAGLCAQGSASMANTPAGGCNTDLYTGNTPPQYSALDVEYTPPAAVGGQCSSAGTGSGNVTYTAERRACVPDSAQSAGCTGEECTLTLAAPYDVCILQSGVQTCPGAPFTEQHLVGTGTSFTCSDCSCSVTASCAGTMELFMDGNCMQQELDVPADGQCHDPNAPNGTYNSYVYLPDPPQGVACTTTASTAEDVALQNKGTLCCAP